MLKDNALIMFDEQTKSVWSHITGEAMAGPLKGRKVRRIASVPKIRWSQVKAEYPEAKVLQVGGRVDVPTSHYAGYHAGSAVGVAPMSAREDRRLDPKELVAGVEVAGTAKAYPHAFLNRRGVLQDELGSTPIVVARVANAEAVVIFDRRLGERILTFDAPNSEGRMKDRETGSVWSALRGVAVDGPLRGQRLTRLPHVDMYWFGWHAYHPRTDLFRE